MDFLCHIPVSINFWFFFGFDIDRTSPIGIYMYTVSEKKRPPFISWISLTLKNWPILMIFGMLNPAKIWHENFTDLYTSPVTCSHFTLGNPKKVIFNSIIHTYIWLFYYLRRKQTVIHLPTPPENVATLTCDLWIAKLFHLTEGLLHSFKRWRLWREQVRPRPLIVAVALKRTGCDVWQLEYVIMSGKRCHSKCLEWPATVLIHASSRFRHCSRSTPRCAEIHTFRNKPLPQASTCPYQYMRSSCSVPQSPRRSTGLYR